MQRERQTQHGDGAGIRGRPAGHAGSGRPPADDQAAGDHPTPPQLGYDRDPRRVELRSRRRAAPARDAVGLLDEHDAQARRQRHVGRGDQVASADTAAGAVAEDERPGRAALAVDVGPRGPVRSLDLELAHGAPARVRHSAPRCAPNATASSIEDPPARANVTPAANESPQP